MAQGGFNIYQREILNFLYVAQRPVNTSRIARRTNMAWQTAKDNLEDLHKRGYVNSRERGNSTQWWLRERY